MKRRRAENAEEYRRLLRRFLMGLELTPPLRPLPASVVEEPEPVKATRARKKETTNV